MPELMPIIYAVAIVTAVGIVCAVMLAIASKIFEVKTNPKITQVRDCLPGANCGACGYAGCDGYAKALAEGDEDRVTLCTPGAAKAVMEAAAIPTKRLTTMVVKAVLPQSLSMVETVHAFTDALALVTVYLSANMTLFTLLTVLPGLILTHVQHADFAQRNVLICSSASSPPISLLQLNAVIRIRALLLERIARLPASVV